jgi:hypothetical protein
VYAVVYKANQDRIRNPNRIYPGQIFILPVKALLWNIGRANDRFAPEAAHHRKERRTVKAD